MLINMYLLLWCEYILYSFNKIMPLTYSYDTRVDLATRLSGGQTPTQIAETLNISLKTVYRLKKSFIRDCDTYVAPPMTRTVRQKIDREKLLQLSQIMKTTPNITLK